MPKISRFFIKSGMLFLLFGIFIYAISEFPGFNDKLPLLPVYWHMIALGWITQIIMGVSLWMFPKGKNSLSKHGSKLAWISFFSLNLGLLLRFVSEPFLYVHRELLQVSYLCSIVLQILGVFCFILEIWPRLTPVPRKPV
ncbi:hypothetical protein LEP1GSC202_1514 [Leptospira yanagawae serovar Saopaulo str. Sao Paulo = ATCC 700523]|uniref:Uncharacterized protein n=1 Tax=Leptospira yanagawae serovar Saopaulo str. Sao Paulo = ATCC 700523 TaxID=1249483 RepID=A0A5E8HEH2_9LEPT|nr:MULTISPECIES: hypothetical protein [Leptospira]EOQ89088.1 hypothetical protein LEP1GSC202_1514 [Leptospira yanagawae serovar Saopaulo str. Sao Paulo = ATCC 700523]TGM79482.1 hypothetical protein EHQ99_06905 [Leptospira bouyouniensis]